MSGYHLYQKNIPIFIVLKELIKIFVLFHKFFSVLFHVLISQIFSISVSFNFLSAYTKI